MRFALVALPAILLFLLFGCATRGPYWIEKYEPVAHTQTVFVDLPCGRSDWNGCADRSTGVIALRKGMTRTEAWCSLNHEKRHLDGYVHPGYADGAFALDCGNGETL